MICSTSTESDRTLKSDICNPQASSSAQGQKARSTVLVREPQAWVLSLRAHVFTRVAAGWRISGASLMQVARMPSDWPSALTPVRSMSGALFGNLRIAPRRRPARAPSAGTAGPTGCRARRRIFVFALHRVPEAVVVDDARDVRPGRQHRLQRPLDRLLERAPVDLVLHARGERHLAERPGEVPVLGGRRRVADDLDLARVAAAEARGRARDG